MGKGFTVFKDRIWFVVDRCARGLAKSPWPLQKIGYGGVRGVLWAAYSLPRSPLRSTARSYARVLDRVTARTLYAGFTDRFVWALHRTERLRLGHLDETDDAFEFPDAERLRSLVQGKRGAVLVFPHCHATLLAVRGLAREHKVLFLQRQPLNEARAAAMQDYYQNVGADLLDVRNTPDVAVARKVVAVLRSGGLVVGVTDRIKHAPPRSAPYAPDTDMYRVQAFGQPVGAVGWPARFAGKLGASILPCMVELTERSVRLHLGPEVSGKDERKVTQAWMSALLEMCQRFPFDWGFVYDKFWSRVLAQPERQTSVQDANDARSASTVQ